MLGRSRDILLVICCASILCAYLLFSSIVSREEGVVFYVRPGVSKKVVVTELSQQGIVTHSFFFTLYTTLYKNSQIKTGEYLFPKGSSLYSIWRQITTGKGHYNRAFTIIPGWTFLQLSQQLQATPTLKHLMQNYDKPQLMLALGAPLNTDPEGQFFPETYNYTRDVPDLVILQRAYELMQQRLKEAWESRSAALPYKTPYDVLIAASLVEKEAYLMAERKIIAGVIINRIQRNMLLQIDPTVIYGMGENYHGTIHRQDLLTDTVYNTYLHKGLPPTPIAMPSQASLDAAAHPAVHDFVYFVAKGDGSHQFTKTLEEHHQAVDLAKEIKGVANVAR